MELFSIRIQRTFQLVSTPLIYIYDIQRMMVFYKKLFGQNGKL